MFWVEFWRNHSKQEGFEFLTFNLTEMEKYLKVKVIHIYVQVLGMNAKYN